MCLGQAEAGEVGWLPERSLQRLLWVLPQCDDEKPTIQCLPCASWAMTLGAVSPSIHNHVASRAFEVYGSAHGSDPKYCIYLEPARGTKDFRLFLAFLQALGDSVCV